MTTEWNVPRILPTQDHQSTNISMAPIEVVFTVGTHPRKLSKSGDAATNSSALPAIFVVMSVALAAMKVKWKMIRGFRFL